jgi:hypothetical protein
MFLIEICSIPKYAGESVILTSVADPDLDIFAGSGIYVSDPDPEIQYGSILNLLFYISLSVTKNITDILQLLQ